MKEGEDIFLFFQKFEHSFASANLSDRDKMARLTMKLVNNDLIYQSAV